MIGDRGGERLLLENRNDLYEDVYAAEMEAFESGALTRVVSGLWSSREPLNRQVATIARKFCAISADLCAHCDKP